jgi:hypothetical protein
VGSEEIRVLAEGGVPWQDGTRVYDLIGDRCGGIVIKPEDVKYVRGYPGFVADSRHPHEQHITWNTMTEAERIIEEQSVNTLLILAEHARKPIPIWQRN